MNIILGEGATLSVIEARTSGATLRLDYGRASFLFPVGLDAKTGTALATSGQVEPTTVLLAPKQGSANSLSAFFLDAAQPSVIVIAVGDGQQPHAQTLQLFKDRNALRTDQRGAISFATDGKQLWVEAER